MGENRADDFSRRSFLKGTAAVSLGSAVGATSLGTAVSAAWMAPAAAAELPPTPPHGAELRGMDLVTQSPTTEGRFGFMFKNQPPHPASIDYEDSIELLDNLGATMEEQPVAPQYDKTTTTPPTKTPTHASRPGSPSLASSSTTTSPSTPRSSSDQQSDPDATTNFRTPRYDLDAIYGLGPSTNPQFYDPSDRDKFLIENVPTPRSQASSSSRTARRP